MSLDKLFENKYFHRAAVIGIVIILFVLYKWSFYYDQTTNYAFVWAQTIDMSSEVSGTVQAVTAKDYSFVKKGDQILLIDPDSYQYAYNKAKANYDEQKIAFQTVTPQIGQAEAALQQAITDSNVAKDHLARITPLYKNNIVSQVDYVNAEAAVEKAAAGVNFAQSNLDIIKSKSNYTELDKAEADYDIAKYNLDHTVMTAPANGDIVNLLIQPGGYINKGEPLFGIIKTDEWWVVGRYRETVLRNIHVGDKAEVSIDMYPYKTFHGYVERIGWGINRREASSDAAPSTLPYIEATEYWIRLAQRFPVWVRLVDVDASTPLRVGGNASVTVLNEKYLPNSKSK
jgi:multidrug resistance efflux pump